MAFTKTPAAGSRIAIKINGNYVNIPGCEGIPDIGPAKSFYENTAIDETAKTFNADLPDYGEFTLVGSHDGTDEAHKYMMASARNVDATETLKVTYSDEDTAEFDALIGSFKVNAVKGGDKKFSSQIRITGEVNYINAA